MGRNFLDNPVLLIVLILLIVMLFGAKRLPDAARSVGRSMRIFKSEVKEMRSEGDRPHPPSEPVEGRVLDRPGTSDDVRQGRAEDRADHRADHVTDERPGDRPGDRAAGPRTGEQRPHDA
jgi:sec-independent protein translocase protein TatA